MHAYEHIFNQIKPGVLSFIICHYDYFMLNALKQRIEALWYQLRKNMSDWWMYFFPARARAGPKIVLVPPRSIFIYIYMFVRTWKIIMPFIHVVLEECTP